MTKMKHSVLVNIMLPFRILQALLLNNIFNLLLSYNCLIEDGDITPSSFPPDFLMLKILAVLYSVLTCQLRLKVIKYC